MHTTHHIAVTGQLAPFMGMKTRDFWDSTAYTIDAPEHVPMGGTKNMDNTHELTVVGRGLYFPLGAL